jgi:hypothetical protein
MSPLRPSLAYGAHRYRGLFTIFAALTLFVVTFISSAHGQTEAASKSAGASAKLDAKHFADPPIEYRPVDCWWWDNAALTKERLLEQLEDMHAKGSGGTWLYPRFGASQPRSSDPGFWTDGWWEFVRSTLDEHQRLGMVQYANDWLGRLDKAYFQTQLRNESKHEPKLVGHRLTAHFARSTGAGPLTLEIPEGQTLLSASAYKLREANEHVVEDDTRVDLSDSVNGRTISWDAPAPEWLIVAVCSQPHDLNYLEPHVAKRWIEIFYEEYSKRLGDRLGKSLTAYGPDERSVLGGNILYCDDLRQRFEKKNGYDPLADLAALFLDIGPRTDSVRCQYYEVMNSLLEENLYAPMAKWLHDRNMLHVTIATWGRQNMLDQTNNYGDFPRMMKYFDIPGNEDSKESGPLGAFIDTKLSSSMSHLNGKKRTAVCAYWGMGWGYTQEENIARTNINYALGINLYNTHGVLYSLNAGRNEWVPPETHFYQPYWQTWRTFADYVSRLSYALSQGRHCADVAIVYPLSTIHASWYNGSKFDPTATEAQNATFGLAKSLYVGGLDFDFVDEARLAEAASAKGNINVSGLEFPVVILPTLSTIRSDAMAQLKKFVEAGGTLVVFKKPPTSSPENGRDDPDLQQLWQDLLGDYAAGTDAIVERRNDAGGRTILVRGSEADAGQAIRAAVRADVTVNAEDVIHTHQQVGDQHVYFFVNRQPVAREVDVEVRATGRPELWDASTGKTQPLYRFNAMKGGTKLRLSMEPYAGTLVVLQPESAGPQIIDGNLATVSSVVRQGGDLEVVGTSSGERAAKVVVSLDGKTYTGESAAPATVATPLEGAWTCQLRPTMNNKWGDYRYPASDTWIGPEVPRMRYQAETAAETQPRWAAADFNDREWPLVTATFGPYWQVLDPLAARADSDSVRSKIVDDAGQSSTVDAGGKQLRWQPYTFSWKFGADRTDVHQVGFEGVGPVPPNFLVLDAIRGGQSMVRYLTTRVYSPREQELYLNFGGRDKAPQRQAWVNGQQVLDVKNAPLAQLPKVKLKSGWNQIVLRLVQTGSRPLSTYAVLHAEPEPPVQPRFMPLLEWYNVAPDLIYDCLGESEKTTGWYRFMAPPGAKRAKLNLVAESVEAWVNGKSVKVQDDAIELPASSGQPTEAVSVALRVRHKPGFYEGAAFTAPVSFDCGPGKIAAGDWNHHGLEYYSGGLKYQRTLTIKAPQNGAHTLLDLGDVRTSAEVKVNGKSVGVRLARPFVFDLTDSIQPGDNEIEVEVLNTLANFMSAGPTKYVYKGQTVSGLMGPVMLRTVPEVRIRCRPESGSEKQQSGANQ